MDDYRKLMLLDSRREDLVREAQRARNSLPAGFRLGIPQILVTLAVMLLGMLAWWGQ